MVEFIIKSESRDDKIARVNSIRITKLLIYFHFVRFFFFVMLTYLNQPHVHSPFIEESMIVDRKISVVTKYNCASILDKSYNIHMFQPKKCDP